jgi:hypothetical protein
MLPSFTHSCSSIRCVLIIHLKKPRGMASINILSFFQFSTSIFSFWTVLSHTCLSSVSLDGFPLLFLCLLASCHDLIPRILPVDIRGWYASFDNHIDWTIFQFFKWVMRISPDFLVPSADRERASCARRSENWDRGHIEKALGRKRFPRASRMGSQWSRSSSPRRLVPREVVLLIRNAHWFRSPFSWIDLRSVGSEIASNIETIEKKRTVE